MTQARRTIGIVGARGYVGSELIRLIGAHRGFELEFVSSRALAGEMVRDHVHEVSSELRFEDLDTSEVARREVDALVLALPNGLATPFVGAVEAVDKESKRVIVDISADYRFDDAWIYGQPERLRQSIRGAKRISNPGCYATGGQLALWPIRDLIDGAASVFGVSGYSGAGTTPSPKNDPDVLRDNLIPYALTDHVHEREIAHQLQCDIQFMPHVAPFFRGITLTITASLCKSEPIKTISALFDLAYENEPLVRWLGQTVPLVRDIANKHHVEIGGLTLSKDGRRVVIVATLDNLLKGAATQAMQNINLALGIDELEGIGAP